MRKMILMLAMMLPMFVISGCSDDEDTQQSAEREVTVSELENGTGTWMTWYSSAGDEDVFYVGFNDGRIVYADGDFVPYYTGEYTIEGRILLVTTDTGTYELKIYFITVDGTEYLQIDNVGENRLPGFESGALRKSEFSFFD